MSKKKKEKLQTRRYRSIDGAIRTDARFRALSAPPPNAQDLWLHLLTCGHDRSIPGLLYVGLGTLSDELGWPLEDIRRCFAEIEAQGLGRADWNSRVAWLPEALAPGRNEPRSPDNVTGIPMRDWLDVPECDLKWAAYRAYINYCAGRGERFIRAAIEALPANATERDFAESFVKSCSPKGGAKDRPKGHPSGTGWSTPSSSSSSSSSSSPKEEQRTDPAREPLQLVALPEAIPSSKTTKEKRRDAKAAAEARTAKIRPFIEAWNGGADERHQEPAPSPQTRHRDDGLSKLLLVYPHPVEWEDCARALCLDAYWAPKLQLLDLTRKAGGQHLERFMREGKRGAKSQASTTWEGRELL